MCMCECVCVHVCAYMHVHVFCVVSDIVHLQGFIYTEYLFVVDIILSCCNLIINVHILGVPGGILPPEKVEI